jgi:threonine/homoserine efflux transporter RhtA
MLIVAYTRAPVAELTRCLSLQIAFAAAGGLLVIAHVPDARSLAGIALISDCGVSGPWLTARELRACKARLGAPDLHAET